MADCRHLVVVLGDQLDREAAAFDDFDAAHDIVWMAEASDESTHIRSSQQRTTLFLAAMRHFAQALRDEGLVLDYREMHEGSLGAALTDAVRRHRPQRVLLTLPGEWRVLEALRAAVGEVPIC